MLLGGAKELGIVHISIIKGVKEPKNLQNHKGGKVKEEVFNGCEHGSPCAAGHALGQNTCMHNLYGLVWAMQKPFACLSCPAGAMPQTLPPQHVF